MLGVVGAFFRWAHPRSRGENQHDGPVTVEARGSSPLTRGKRCLVWSARFFDGLIPAHAGKTGPTVGAGPPRGGSSPLTRGKPRVGEDSRDLARLIPAHAGKTQGPSPHTRCDQAHPRSRGENTGKFMKITTDQGSSPLTRGKHPISIHMLLGARLIPAHAGKTFSVPFGCRREPAHPRSRGENYRMGTATRYVEGSSPLTRGKLPHGNGDSLC